MDSDSGDYKCIIKNPTGEITTTAKINMKGIVEQLFHQRISCTDVPQKCHVKSVQCCK